MDLGRAHRRQAGAGGAGRAVAGPAGLDGGPVEAPGEGKSAQAEYFGHAVGGGVEEVEGRAGSGRRCVSVDACAWKWAWRRRRLPHLCTSILRPPNKMKQ